MSIISELNKTKDYLRSSRDAVLARGGEISPTAGLKDLPNAIYNIPADSSLAFPSDDTVAYRKIVPVGVEQMARVETLGGMTYKCNNLIPSNYNNLSAKNGLTPTVNPDGSITISGTTTSSNQTTWVCLNWVPVNIPAGTYTMLPMEGSAMGTYRISVYVKNAEGVELSPGFQSFAPNNSQTKAESITAMYLSIDYYPAAVGENVNMTFYPMLNAGSTALPYEPFFEGLRSAKVTSLKSEGANLIPFPYRMNTANGMGLTADANSDGSIRVHGTATEVGRLNPYFISALPVFFPKGTTFSIPAVEGSGWNKFQWRVAFYEKSGGRNLSLISDSTQQTKTTSFDCTLMYLDIGYWTTAVGEEVDITFYPMLNYGSTAAPFTPYRAEPIDTLAIPEWVQSLPDYGEGVSADYSNRIKFADKKYRQEAQRIVFDGHEDIFTNDRGDYREYYINLKRHGYANSPTNSNNIELVSTKYRATSRNYQYDHPEEMGIISITSQFLRWNDVYMTAEEMQAKLKAWYDEGNPLEIVRVLAEPIETDISAYLTSDGFFKVQGGGTVVAENEYEYAVPSKINYVQKVGN